MGSLCTNYGTRWTRKNSVKKKNAFPVSPLCAPCQTCRKSFSSAKKYAPWQARARQETLLGKARDRFSGLVPKNHFKKTMKEKRKNSHLRWRSVKKRWGGRKEAKG
jgi:hypothetical protein